MGRRKIKMEMVKDAGSRLVTFSKRRNGVFKKANELAILCGAELAIVVFSPGGKPFSFGHPSVDVVTQRFLRHLEEEDDDEEEAKYPAGGMSSSKKASRKAEKLNQRLMNLTKQLEEEKKKGEMLDKAIEEKKFKCGLGPETSPDDLSKLERLRQTLEKLRDNVKLRKTEMEAASSLLQLAEELQLEEDDDVAESDSHDGKTRNGNSKI
ncbi:agamous-like MADS-box protein AGL29 [Prosopis cineraria]|uniref:agamous-like MADS-box protein AGL29 n=1 Tax=Prosopis cineraria TaxID=364024 RepID=UPI00240EDD28|nr:agamous-like MADS-box protein AGL29 [Prosopis cineraria]XP_054801496.1 agamous-like MADS-box protein AGL29 [Prosopis cineraria]